MSADTTASPGTLAARFTIGILQGAALYVLSDMNQNGTEAQITSWLYATLVLCAMLLPLVWLAGLGSMRNVTLAVWSLLVTGTVVAVTLHAEWRDPHVKGGDHLWLIFPLIAATFIGHHLIAAADADRRPIAGYATYFDISWKNSMQLALSLAFVGAFWLLLFLGANLFELIGITFVRQVIDKVPFMYLSSCTVFALAVHITDVRVSLITGARTIALLLLSWLLPVMTLFAVTFLASLPFTGLKLLWATGHASTILVLAGVALITLINASYQDGVDEHAPAAILKWSARLASLALAPITIIAFYSIWLRVQQYGLTPERVMGLAVIALGACYATGYVIAALWPGQWMKPIELTNIAAATFAVVIVTALLTPFADPARIAVADQVARLHAGRISLDKFDFNFLRFEAGPYGLAALDHLATDKSTPAAVAIATKAEEARQRKERQTGTTTQTADLTVDELRQKITVIPSGATLPEAFLTQDWTSAPSSPRTCVRDAAPGFTCQAMFADIDRDNTPEILLRNNDSDIVAFHQAAGGKWELLGRFGTVECDTGTAGNFASGAIRTAPSVYNDLEIRGHRLHIETPCPPPSPASQPR